MPIYFLRLAFIFTTSCNAQNTTQLLKDSLIKVGQPKIIKTQHTSQSVNFCGGLQDKSGNLWFATTGEGVYRYDGQSFTNFTVRDGLGNNNVSCILEDKVGNLWFGTNIGVCRYDGNTFTTLLIPTTDGADFLPFPGAADLKNAPPSTTVTSIIQDKSGNLWFGTLGWGVYRYDGKSFTNFLSPEVIVCILEDKTGNIWFGSWSNWGAFRYDGKTFTNFTTQDGLSDNMISGMIEDKAQNILFATRDHGVCRYDGTSFFNLLDHTSISSILEDKAGNLWFGTDGKWGNDGNGVYRYDGSSFTNFTTKDGLSNNNVFCILEDKTGNIWFGTRESGLCRYDGKSFTDFVEKETKE